MNGDHVAIHLGLRGNETMAMSFVVAMHPEKSAVMLVRWRNGDRLQRVRSLRAFTHPGVICRCRRHSGLEYPDEKSNGTSCRTLLLSIIYYCLPSIVYHLPIIYQSSMYFFLLLSIVYHLSSIIYRLPSIVYHLTIIYQSSMYFFYFYL